MYNMLRYLVNYSNPPILSLNNNTAVPSQLNNNIDSVSVGVYVDDSICLDLEIGVNDPADHFMPC